MSAIHFTRPKTHDIENGIELRTLKLALIRERFLKQSLCIPQVRSNFYDVKQDFQKLLFEFELALMEFTNDCNEFRNSFILSSEMQTSYGKLAYYDHQIVRLLDFTPPRVYTLHKRYRLEWIPNTRHCSCIFLGNRYLHNI